VVLVYQGSLGGPSFTWGTLTPEVPFGGFRQGLLQARLLDEGFTVIAPEAAAGVAWQTNSGVPYELSTDKLVIDALTKGGFEAKLIVDPAAGHEWLAKSPELVTGWFQSH
jgi:hypothetical protein